MKKVANLLAVIGVSLVVYSIVVKFTGQLDINWGFVRTKIRTGLILATFLMLLAIFIKLSIKEEKDFIIRTVSKRRILFWLSAVVITGLFFGLLSFFLITSVRRLSDQEVIEKFHKIYYTNILKVKGWPHYLGITSMQYPTDNWVMQEILSEIKPDFIIETGTGKGATALFYATILEKINENGKVITVDINPHSPKVSEFKTWRERVEFIKGSSVSPEVITAIAERVKGHKVLVTLDSLHSKEHVLKELKLYTPFVSLDSYIVVQDTQLGGHPNHHLCVPDEGPWEAVEEFLKTNKDFEIDHNREKHLITQNPSGFLKRVK